MSWWIISSLGLVESQHHAKQLALAVTHHKADEASHSLEDTGREMTMALSYWAESTCPP